MGEHCICYSRVKRLQLQMRGLLRRLVAVRVKATNEINFRREREREREREKKGMTSFHFPLNLYSVFSRPCISRSDSILKLY